MFNFVLDFDHLHVLQFAMMNYRLLQVSKRGVYFVNNRCHYYSTNSVGDNKSQESPLTSLNSDIPKAYEPILHEAAWIQKWTQRKSLDRKDSDSRVFRMLLPPPNVTGKLHLGHALTIAIQDTIARWYKFNETEFIKTDG